MAEPVNNPSVTAPPTLSSGTAVVTPSRGAGLAGLRRRFRPRPPGAITALDVDGQILWVAQAAPRGSRVGITRVDSAPLSLPADADRNDPAAVGQAIAQALVKLRIKPSSVVMGIPRAQLVLRTLTLPVIEDVRELASMVHFQVSKDLPFRAEDAVIDFKVHRQIDPPPVLPGAEGAATPVSPVTPRLEVLVAAVQRDVVAFCEQTAEAAGLKLAALGLRAYANARCVQLCETTPDGEALAVVSLRPDEVNIDVIVEQALLFSRGAMVRAGGEGEAAQANLTSRTENEDSSSGDASATAVGPGGASSSPTASASAESAFVEEATIEVVRTLHGYGGMAARNPVRKVVVTGASGREEAVAQSLARRLSVPCRLLDPAGALDLAEDARVNARGAIAAIGLALGYTDAEGLPFDFLDPKKPVVQRDMRRIRILAGAAAAIALLLVLALVRNQLVQRRMAIQQQVRSELADAEKKRAIYRNMRQQASTVDEWMRGGRNWLDHYAYLSAILPASEDVYITSFSTSPQGLIRLSVQARSGEVLSRLDKQLRAAGYEIKPLNYTPGADRFGYEFSSTVELTVPDKMSFDLARVRPPARPSDDGSMDPGALKGGRP